MGWFKTPEQLHQDASNIIANTYKLYEAQENYIKNYYKYVKKSKDDIVVELYSLAVGPLKD